MKKSIIVAIVFGLLWSVFIGAGAATGGKLGEQIVNFVRAFAGERNEDSSTGQDYQAVSAECGMSAQIDLSGNASTTVNSGPTILCGYRLIVTVGAFAVTLDDGSTAKMTLPVSWPVGEHDGFGAIFESSLVVNPDDTSTGTLQVFYKPAPAYLNWVP